MKKSLFATLLILSILVGLLCSCEFKRDESDEPEPTESETAAPTQKATDAKEAYKSIKRAQYSAFEKHYFGFEGEDSALVISLPKGTGLTKGADGYTLKVSGKTIGSLFTGKATDLSSWEEISDMSSSANGLKKTIHVEYNAAQGSFRHRMEYAVGEDFVTLICDYAALDDEAARMVGISARTEDIGNSLSLNMLSELKDKKIIILGNSFINSSRIGDTLRAMINANGKSLDVTAVSRGYAEVDTYIGDAALMEDIANGVYDGVFICGFYALEEADHLKVLEEQCKISDTELVILPAHNEFRDCIAAAQKKCPDLKTLDWKAEIDALIESGIDKWYFCVNDVHGHSTPPAGYVGAQMIYRAIYGEIPTADFSTFDVDTAALKTTLGDYMTTGKIPTDIVVNYFD